MKILVVDDSTQISSLALGLEKLGYSIIHAKDYQQAVQLFQQNESDFIILNSLPQSTFDLLTGVNSRLQFEKISKEIYLEKSRADSQFALMFIDLDHFKIINDGLGHEVGDEVLKESAKRLMKCISPEDVIARIGGDEFAIILNSIKDQENVVIVAQKIIDEFASVFKIGMNSIHLTASIGIACYPQHGTTLNLLKQSADFAISQAKKFGRNNFQFFSEELSEKYRKVISLENELKFALERNEFFIIYQPVFNLTTKKLVGMEALLRWNHPELGLISPNIFIQLAEETGLIIQIGSWVLNQVCQQGAKWRAQGYDFIMAVNVSVRQIVFDHFYEILSKILKETHMPPSCLELELTETTVIKYTSQLKKTINQIHELGVGISVDDFGTRYSSLTSLRALPIKTLKIDKSFMKDVINDPKNNSIVKALIGLGNSLKLNVIAEGLQSEEQIEFLVTNGCQHGQGFYLSKPLDKDEMTKLLGLHAQK